jgi:hypothetical protein
MWEQSQSRCGKSGLCKKVSRRNSKWRISTGIHEEKKRGVWVSGEKVEELLMGRGCLGGIMGVF